jgi:hypothetical protein
LRVWLADPTERSSPSSPDRRESGLGRVAQSRDQSDAQPGTDESADDIVVVAAVGDMRLEASISAQPLQAGDALGAGTSSDPAGLGEGFQRDRVTRRVAVVVRHDQVQVFAQAA